MADEIEIPRDVRVDQICFANELWTKHVEKINAAVKGRMIERGMERVQGDIAEAVLSGGSAREIEADKFLRLYEKGKIKRKDFITAIAVKIGPSEQFLSANDIDAICIRTKRAPSLTVKRKTGVEIKLVQALEGLGAAIRSEIEAAA